MTSADQRDGLGIRSRSTWNGLWTCVNAVDQGPEVAHGVLAGFFNYKAIENPSTKNGEVWIIWPRRRHSLAEKSHRIQSAQRRRFQDASISISSVLKKSNYLCTCGELEGILTHLVIFGYFPILISQYGAKDTSLDVDPDAFLDSEVEVLSEDEDEDDDEVWVQNYHRCPLSKMPSKFSPDADWLPVFSSFLHRICWGSCGQ